jgi:hypothetical protein
MSLLPTLVDPAFLSYPAVPRSKDAEVPRPAPTPAPREEVVCRVVIGPWVRREAVEFEPMDARPATVVKHPSGWVAPWRSYVTQPERRARNLRGESLLGAEREPYVYTPRPEGTYSYRYADGKPVETTHAPVLCDTPRRRASDPLPHEENLALFMDTWGYW